MSDDLEVLKEGVSLKPKVVPKKPVLKKPAPEPRKEKKESEKRAQFMVPPPAKLRPKEPAVAGLDKKPEPALAHKEPPAPPRDLPIEKKEAPKIKEVPKAPKTIALKKPEKPQESLKEKQREEARTFFKEGLSLYKRTFFKEAADQFNKVLNAPRVSFWLKMRSKKLRKKSLKKLQKKQRLASQRTPTAKITPDTPEQKRPVIKKPFEQKEKVTEPTLPPAPRTEPRVLPKLSEPAPAPPPQPKPQEAAKPQTFTTPKVPAAPTQPAAQKELPKPEITEPRIQKIPRTEPRVPPPLAFSPQKAPFNWRRLFLALTVLVIIISGGFGVYYYLTYPEPTPEETEPPTIIEAPLPEVLLSGQFSQVIDYTDQAALAGQMQEVLAQDTKDGYLKNIFVKKIENFEEKYLTLEEILVNFDSQIPENIRGYLSGQYNLLVYQQKLDDSVSPFEKNFFQNKRMVLVLELKDKEALYDQLKEWEQTALQNLNLLYLEKDPQIPEQRLFQENFYRGTLIRYLNLPASDLSLDYVVIDDLLILASSKESTFAVVDKILENF